MVAMAAVVDRYGFMLAGLSDEEVRARRVRTLPLPGVCLSVDQS